MQKQYYVWREGEEDCRYFCVIKESDHKKRITALSTFSFCPAKLSSFFSDSDALPAKAVTEISYPRFQAAYETFLQTIQTKIDL